ncbi:MAG: SpoIID/LytB domain-containing protein, partial [Clostridium sp.]|nr:SpoIID/LytB domain-containing protein [Clostridium sp.]
GVEFRNLFNINSANFTLNIVENEVIINCTGYGHGVGMSQWGANIMAKEGKNYKDILKHYYSGVNIEKVILED